MWEPPIAYTGAVTGYLVASALYCEYKPLHEARSSKKLTPGEARRLTRKMLATLKNAPDKGRFFVRTTLIGEIEGYPLVVSPDAVYMENGVPRGVIKSRIRPSLRHYTSDWVSLVLSSYILAEAYGVDNIMMALVLGADKTALMQALQAVKRDGPRPRMGENWRVVTRVYTGLEDLAPYRRAVDVIVGRAHPTPPPSERCPKCQYRSQCPWRRD